jgi:hypothetical protein
MRHAKLTLLALLTAGAAMTTGVGPAAAFDYPYCIQGRDAGYPGDCSYRSFAECRATASGRNADCGVNPRTAFGAVPRGRRYHRNYD